MAWQSVYGMDEDLEEGPRSIRELVMEPYRMRTGFTGVAKSN